MQEANRRWATTSRNKKCVGARQIESDSARKDALGNHADRGSLSRGLLRHESAAGQRTIGHQRQCARRTRCARRPAAPASASASASEAHQLAALLVAQAGVRVRFRDASRTEAASDKGRRGSGSGCGRQSRHCGWLRARRQCRRRDWRENGGRGVRSATLKWRGRRGQQWQCRLCERASVRGRWNRE